MDRIDKPVIGVGVLQGENVMRIQKVLPQNYVDRTIGDLVSYITDPKGDDINPAYQTDDEKALARRMNGWLKDPSNITLNYVRENGSFSQPLGLTDRVSTHLDDMLIHKQEVNDNGVVEYDEADLRMQYGTTGGI